jgi:hypothetical protein
MEMIAENNEPIKLIKSDECLLSKIYNKYDLIANLMYSKLSKTELFETYTNEKINIILNNPNKILESIDNKKHNIDGIYETKNKIMLVKYVYNYKINNKDIKKLYHSYYTLYDAINKKNIKKKENKKNKEIMILLINKKKDIIHILKYEFENPMDMNSIKNINHRTYFLISGELTN